MLILDEQIIKEIKQKKCRELRAAFVELKMYLRTYLQSSRDFLSDIEDGIRCLQQDGAMRQSLFNPGYCKTDQLIAEFLTMEQIQKWCESYIEKLDMRKHANTQGELC